jgi:hypothetical protein
VFTKPLDRVQFKNIVSNFMHYCDWGYLFMLKVKPFVFSTGVFISGWLTKFISCYIGVCLISYVVFMYV